MVQVCWLGAFWSRAASLVPGEADRSLISESSFLMALYCFVVVEERRALASVSWWRVRPLFVAASAMRLRWPSSACRANSPAGW